MQLFVDAGVPVSGDLVEEMVRDVIREKVMEIVRETQAQQRGEEERRETERALYVYTWSLPFPLLISGFGLQSYKVVDF